MQFEKDIASKFSGLFSNARELILEFDGVSETKKDKITTYSCGGSGLCHLRTMPHGIDVGFLKGVLMEDKYGLLHGKTKRMRVLSLESFDEEKLKYYIAEAVKINI